MTWKWSQKVLLKMNLKAGFVKFCLIHSVNNFFSNFVSKFTAWGRLVKILQKMFLRQEKKKWVLSKSGLRIIVGRLVKLLEKKNFEPRNKKWVLSKSGLRIIVGRLVKLLEKQILSQEKKSEYFPKMVLELL